jgi:HSP20 family molecular chaperone IbpA
LSIGWTFITTRPRIILTWPSIFPACRKEDVSIDVHNNVLAVSGENKASSERTDGGYVVRERRYGKFTRSLSLPQGLKVSLLDMLFNSEVLMT